MAILGLGYMNLVASRLVRLYWLETFSLYAIISRHEHTYEVVTSRWEE
jgi:hypothetical protein